MKSKLPYVPRQVTARGPEGEVSRPLSEWAKVPGYVLLGDPGAGKTWALRHEAERAGTTLISARQLLADDSPLPGSAPVFVDALDEAYAHVSGDVLSRVLAKLRRHEPGFRVACREYEWLAHRLHSAAEEQLAPEEITVLRLEPLRDEDILRMLTDRGDRDPQSFLLEATQHGIGEILRNPLLLDLLWDLVRHRGTWPATRMDLYDSTCAQLASEHAEGHRGARVRRPGEIDGIREDSGLLFSILLLSGRQAIALHEDRGEDLVSIPELPALQALRDAKAALQSKLFASDGRAFEPRHRTIAEFEGGKVVAARILDAGLPLDRVLALCCDDGGQPRPELRGLLAWVAAHSHGSVRERLLRLDPLGFVIHADAGVLIDAERQQVWQRLGEIAEQDPWLLEGAWWSHPFGALATVGQRQYIAERLASPSDDPAGTAFLRCLLMGLAHAGHADTMPELAEPLQRLASKDGPGELRDPAYRAWRRHVDEDTRRRQLASWLNEFRARGIARVDQSLLGNVLADAFPGSIGAEVLDYLPQVEGRAFTRLDDFWTRQFVPRIHGDLLPTMLSAWAEKFPAGHDPRTTPYDVRSIAHQLVARALRELGERATPRDLCEWLDLLLGREHMLVAGPASLRVPILDWLERHPDRMKEIASFGQEHDGNDGCWRSDVRMQGARFPRDWLLWLMARAAASSDSRFVRSVLEQVGSALLEGVNQFDLPTMEDFSRWVDQRVAQHPEARRWLEAIWSTPVDGWQRELHRSQQRFRAEQEHRRALRRAEFAEHLEKLGKAPLPSWLLSGIALAHESRLTEARGPRSIDRVREFLGGSVEEAEQVLLEFGRLLQRDDLPTCEDLLRDDPWAPDRLGPCAILVAANLACAADPRAWAAWSDALAATLVAAWLVDGGVTPEAEGAAASGAWFAALAEQRPALVAEVIVSYAVPRLRRSKPGPITGLARFGSSASWRKLAELALPGLLRALPTRISAEVRRILNRDLLPALQILKEAEAEALIQEKLARRSLDLGQRFSWLVAKLRFDPAAIVQLSRELGGNRHQRRAEMLGVALLEQQVGGLKPGAIAPGVARSLIEALGPITNPLRRAAGGAYQVDSHDERETMVRSLIGTLVESPDPGAEQHLQELRDAPMLRSWQPHLAFALSQRRNRPLLALTPPDPVDVAKVLENGPPASPADLVALLACHLQSLQESLRGDPEHLVRWFYRDDQVTPRDENKCRDVLCDRLKGGLEKLRVDVVSEARFADDKRCDLKCSCWIGTRQVSVPIEIKKDSHPEVWTAWETQLPRYTNEPSNCGHAIYLVLWFGHRASCADSAGAARSLLQKRVAQHERGRTITVCVMDLTLPPDPKRDRGR
jgi:hypothetical protein